MNILMLGPYRKDLVAFLSSYGDEIRTTEAPLTRDSQFISDIDLIVSYGYRHILKKDILEVFPNRAINLHISLLTVPHGSSFPGQEYHERTRNSL